MKNWMLAANVFPHDHEADVRAVAEIAAAAGAGFIYPICGDMRTMPGLGRYPAAHDIDLDGNGEITGLS